MAHNAHNAHNYKEFVTEQSRIEEESASLLGVGAVRQRQRGSSGSTGSFSNPVSRDSDDDSVELPRPLRFSLQNSTASFQAVPQSSSCPAGCFFLSIAGVIFLSVVAAQLATNSPYLKVSKENSANKVILAEGVRGAVYMYAGCALISAWMWYQQRVRPGVPNSVHEDTDKD